MYNKAATLKIYFIIWGMPQKGSYVLEKRNKFIKISANGNIFFLLI
jgi:hypothetical protein